MHLEGSCKAVMMQCCWCSVWLAKFIELRKKLQELSGWSASRELLGKFRGIEGNGRDSSDFTAPSKSPYKITSLLNSDQCG